MKRMDTISKHGFQNIVRVKRIGWNRGLRTRKVTKKRIGWNRGLRTRKVTKNLTLRLLQSPAKRAKLNSFNSFVTKSK